jgi:hypothetical protein
VAINFSVYCHRDYLRGAENQAVLISIRVNAPDAIALFVRSQRFSASGILSRWVELHLRKKETISRWGSSFVIRHSS